MACAAAMVLCAPAVHAQLALAADPDGRAITVDLDTFATPGELEIEFNGLDYDLPFAVRGELLTLTLPGDLGPGRQVVEVFRVEGDTRTRLVRAIFDTEGAQAWSGTLSLNTGVSVGSARSEGFVTGGLRLGFRNVDESLTAGLALSRGRAASDDGADPFTLTDIFIEARQDIAAGTLAYRFGEHLLFSATDLIDENTRRGVSARFEGDGGTNAARVFALRPSLRDGEDDLDNITGLEDSDDLVLGAMGTHAPFGLSGAQLSWSAFTGRSPELPTEETGDTSGLGVALAMPVLGDVGLLTATADRTLWQPDGGAETEAFAGTLGLSLAYLPPGEVADFGVELELRRLEEGAFTPLNPDRISGEEGIRIGATYASDFWQFGGEYDRATNAIGAGPDDAVDRVENFRFDVAYFPNDFTGSVLNGMSFFGDIELIRQTRLETPVGAPDPADQRFSRLTVGADRFVRGLSWSASYTAERVDTLFAPDGDNWGQWIDLFYSRSAGDALTATAKARVGRRYESFGSFGEVELSAGFRREFEGTDWAIAGEAGIRDYDDPTREGGSFAEFEIARNFTDDVEGYVAAGYEEGADAGDLVDGAGWILTFGLRADFDLFGR